MSKLETNGFNPRTPMKTLRVTLDRNNWIQRKYQTNKDDIISMILKYGNGKRPSVKTIGLQQGENKHEKILREGPSSDEVERFTVKEIMELI